VRCLIVSLREAGVEASDASAFQIGKMTALDSASRCSSIWKTRCAALQSAQARGTRFESGGLVPRGRFDQLWRRACRG
jgi:hypothetical protein